MGELGKLSGIRGDGNILYVAPILNTIVLCAVFLLKANFLVSLMSYFLTAFSF